MQYRCRAVSPCFTSGLDQETIQKTGTFLLPVFLLFGVVLEMNKAVFQAIDSIGL